MRKTLRNHLAKIAFLFLSISFYFIAAATAQDSGGSKTATKKTAKKTLYGQASFYSNKFNGRKTASGEIFSQKKLTCACNVLKLGTWIKVTNLRNGNSVIVKVNDRLHPSMRRIVDLTSAAAHKLGFVKGGLTRVRVDVIGKNKPL
ncbi:MAG: septal ring lytic transglycosylase RlpA family protein [Ferruginibacter sp.]